MENLVLITTTLELLEDHLTENIKTEEIARRLYCSKSTIEKLFRYATNMSIRDYVIRRRMSRAARDLAADQEEAVILDVALKYGYNSHEAFTRAFKSVWNITPSEYRKNPVRYELFPAFRLEKELMAAKILKQNGEPFSYEGREIPLNLHVTCYQLETANLKYAELFADLQNRLDQTKA